MKLTRDKYLTEDEFKRLLACARDRRHKNAVRDRAILAVAGLCGLRSKEVISIRHADCRKLNAEVPLLDIWTAKRRSQQRHPDEVAVPRTAAHALRQWLKRCGSKKAPLPYERVFALTTSQLRRCFAYYRDRAGLNRHYSFHALRHFRGVQLYKRFKDPQLVKESLRHRRLSSTEVYIHAVDVLRKQRATDIEED